MKFSEAIAALEDGKMAEFSLGGGKWSPFSDQLAFILFQSKMYQCGLTLEQIATRYGDATVRKIIESKTADDDADDDAEAWRGIQSDGRRER